MRTALLLTSLLCFAACGTVCDQVAGAEDGISVKGQPCNSNGGVTKHDSTKCNSGLNKCSPSDVQALQNYVQCLDNIGQCNPSSSLSWGLSVIGCSQSLGGVSLSCSAAIN